VYGPNEIEEIWFQVFPTMEAITAAFEADEIDTPVGGFQYLNKADFDADPEITTGVMPGVGIYFLGFDFWTEGYNYYEKGENPNKNPLHDKDLRHAIAYAINVTTIIDVVLGGYGSLADSWVYTDSPGHNTTLEMYEQDIAAATALLENHTPAYYKVGEKWYSGYTDEQLEFTLHTSNDVTEVDVGQSIRDDLLEFGIAVTHKIVDSTTYVDQIYEVKKDYDLFVSSEEPSADPYSDWIFSLIGDPWGWGWAWSPTFWLNKSFNTGYEAIYTAVDPNVPRMKIQGIANRELPMYMLYRGDVITAWRTDKWTGWYNELGGPIYWFNPWSVLDLHWVGG
jgi:ABC-type transport system substrate-binding protein